MHYPEGYLESVKADKTYRESVCAESEPSRGSEGEGYEEGLRDGFKSKPQTSSPAPQESPEPSPQHPPGIVSLQAEREGLFRELVHESNRVYWRLPGLLQLNHPSQQFLAGGFRHLSQRHARILGLSAEESAPILEHYFGTWPV